MNVYKTEHLPSGERASHWSTVIADTYFPLHLTFRDAASFQGRLEKRSLGDVSLSRLQTEPMQYERRRRHIADASGEEYLITIPRNSPVEFHQLGRDVRCDPGGFILERGDEPYRFSYAAANDLCVLKVAKPMLSEKLRNPDQYCARVFDGFAGVGGLLSNMARLLQSDPIADEKATQVLGRQLIELLALAIDGQSTVGHDHKSSVRTAHLRRAEEVIERNLSNPALSPEMVANACGISKRYLHELFSDANSTVSQFIRERRLSAARDLLLMPNSGAIADVAYRFGFSDHAQFSRLFKAMFGRTPSAFRAGQSE
ncbi:helix-turn-helix domain-containing protein [Rhizobium sp. ARZ01]|uniref:AraC-like ligand-binding domain-containing protein n=1 Tax=Rhizobium sp. ARZ01 TaxID=2769313 RepID=UPI0017831ABE|nr:helix-turn-helix domain-containing protein [Rhizobium sp. ARZ01]